MVIVVSREMEEGVSGRAWQLSVASAIVCCRHWEAEHAAAASFEAAVLSALSYSIYWFMAPYWVPLHSSVVSRCLGHGAGSCHAPVCLYFRGVQQAPEAGGFLEHPLTMALGLSLSPPAFSKKPRLIYKHGYQSLGS